MFYCLSWHDAQETFSAKAAAPFKISSKHGNRGDRLITFQSNTRWDSPQLALAIQTVGSCFKNWSKLSLLSTNENKKALAAEQFTWDKHPSQQGTHQEMLLCPCHFKI